MARWLSDPLTGKTSLGRAVWLYGLGGSFLYSALGLLVPETTGGFTAYVLAGLAVGILQSVVLWRCAPNSRSAFVGRLVRAAVIVGLLLMPLMLYLSFTNSDMLLSPSNPWRGP